MACERTGSIIEIQSSANSGLQAVTAPADAELMVVCVACYYGAADYLTGGSLPTYNSVDMTLSADYDSGTNCNACIWTLEDPATGENDFE